MVQTFQFSEASVVTCYSLISGKWTEEEEKRLAEVVHELTSTEPGDIVTQGVSWAAVAERVGTRSEKQCRSKWLNYLNWKQSGGTEWTKEDEINLILRFVWATCHETISVGKTEMQRQKYLRVPYLYFGCIVESITNNDCCVIILIFHRNTL